MTHIARILDADLEGVKAAYPGLTCPVCKALYLGRPVSFGPEFECTCGSILGMDQRTGVVWIIDQPEFPEWETAEEEIPEVRQ